MIFFRVLVGVFLRFGAGFSAGAVPAFEIMQTVGTDTLVGLLRVTVVGFREVAGSQGDVGKVTQTQQDQHRRCLQTRLGSADSEAILRLAGMW